MDYETKATNRKELRLYAKLFRSICGFSPDECIDPVILLDKLPDLEGFEDVRYEIVYGNALPKNVPAQCTQTEDGYLIQIKDNRICATDNGLLILDDILVNMVK